MKVESAEKSLNPADIAGKEDIANFLIRELASILEVSEEDIETDVAFDRYGVDSKSAVQLTGKLSKLTGKNIEPTVLYDFPTIDSLSLNLAQM